MNKFVLIFFAFCILLLSGCVSRLHKYPIIEGTFVPETEKEVEVFIYGNEKDNEKIKITIISIEFKEITKEKYDEAEGYNIIEDFSQNGESRKYYSLIFICSVDNVEYELTTSNVRKFANAKELYRMDLDSEFGEIDMWLYIYENYIFVEFNSPSSGIKLIREGIK